MIKRSHIRGSCSVLNQSHAAGREVLNDKIDKMTQRERDIFEKSREWKCNQKKG